MGTGKKQSLKLSRIICSCSSMTISCPTKASTFCSNLLCSSHVCSSSFSKREMVCSQSETICRDRLKVRCSSTLEAQRASHLPSSSESSTTRVSFSKTDISHDPKDSKRINLSSIRACMESSSLSIFSISDCLSPSGPLASISLSS
jgi:hypothetical protein